MIQEFSELEIHMVENLDHSVDGDLVRCTLQDLLHYPVSTGVGDDCIEHDCMSVVIEAIVRWRVCYSESRLFADPGVVWIPHSVITLLPSFNKHTSLKQLKTPISRPYSSSPSSSPPPSPSSPSQTPSPPHPAAARPTTRTSTSQQASLASAA